MGKQVEFGIKARAEMQKGLNILADAVKATLGPRGRNVAIEKSLNLPPLITKDGVTVARSILLDDHQQNMGAQLVKNVASSTNSVAGDGTTTATVLAQAIFNEGVKVVATGHSPVLVKRGIDKAVKQVVTKLKEISTPVTDPSMIKNIAYISSNNDKELGDIIAEAIAAVGNDGIVSVEEATGFQTMVKYTEGLEIDRGFLSDGFITNPEKLLVELSNPLILIYDDKFNMKGLIHIAESIINQKLDRPLLVISHDIEPEALASMVLNKYRGVLNSCAIRAPGFGDSRRELLGDIAALTGGRLFTNEDHQGLQEATLDQLGSARKVTISRERTIFLEGSGKLDERIALIKNQLKQEGLSGYEQEKLRKRISKLTGGIAVIKVGGSTESEMKERKDRIEDSVNAVKAAIEEGVVSGGGSALIHCLPSLDSIECDIPEEKIGIGIIRKALTVPFSQILINAGVEPQIYVEKLKSQGNPSGFDALRGEFISNMLEKGIIDPTKVVRSALEHAASASGTLLTTEVTIVEAEKPE